MHNLGEASAFQQMVGKLWSDIDESRHFPSTQPLLAHYTSLSTMESIFKGEELWMSHPFLMNDHEELGWGIMKGTERFFNSKRIAQAVTNEDHYRVLMKALMDARDVDGNTHSYDTYIACFCAHDRGDRDGRLSMWRAYGSNGGGVAIVFDTSMLVEDDQSPLIIAPVEYRTTAERYAWIDNAIDIVASAIEALGPTASEAQLQDIADAYFARIRFAALFSKHASFEEEKEWRVVYFPDRDPQGAFKQLMGYAITQKGIEPKLKLRLGERSLGRPLHLEDMVESILLGPTSGSLIARHAMSRLCELTGKPGLASRVHLSSTPYRS